MRIWGTFKIVVGVLAAVSTLFGMMQSASGLPDNWWGPVTLASAALLTLEGVFQLFPGDHRAVVIVLAAMVPIGISSLFREWPPRVWIFAATLAFLEWMIRELSHATGRRELGSLVFSGILGAALANTTVELFLHYWNAPSVWTLRQISEFMFPIGLPWALVLILIAHSGREVLRPEPQIMEPDLGHGNAPN